MHNVELEHLVNQQLNAAAFDDYAPNGLQVEGRREVKKIITGVTACQALLDEAIHSQADAVMVHHGYFWKNESPLIKGMKRQRLRSLLAHDINLYAWHLPLDAHPQLGNNARLARLLDIDIRGEIVPLVNWGILNEPLSGDQLAQRISAALGRTPLHCAPEGEKHLRRLAWCTGGGQGYIDQAAEFGVDGFITGEVSEKTIHSAREHHVHFFAAGHHATERAGIQALGGWLAESYGLDVRFVDIDNPA